MIFGRWRWATRVIQKVGFATGSREARVLIGLLASASTKNAKRLPTAEQVFFAALRLFHDKAAVARVAKELEVSQLAAELTLTKLPKAAIDLASDNRMEQFVEVARRIHFP